MKTATRRSLATALTVIAACTSDGVPIESPNPSAGLSVSPGVDTVFVTDTAHFTALDSLPPGLGPVNWTVSDSRVAVIEKQTGDSALVRAIHQGTATVTAAKGLHAASGVLVVQDLVATKLAFTTQPGNATASSSSPPPVAVTIESPSGHPVPGATSVVTIAIGTNPAGGALAGTTTRNTVNGVATFSAWSIDKAGTGYRLIATAPGLDTATSAAFDITVGPAVRLVFAMQPSNTDAGTAITPAVQVAAQDAGGNTVTAFVGNVTIAIGTNPASGVLSGKTTVQAVGGVATFTDLSIDKSAPGYTLRATSGAFAGAVSGSFAIAPVATALHITTTTTGAALPNGYSLCVDPFSGYSYSYGCGSSDPIGANGAVTVPVAAGGHSVEIDDVPRNCGLVGDTTNPRAVTAIGTTEVRFSIACLDTGTVRVEVTTTGADLDQNGYSVCVNRATNSCVWGVRVLANDVTTIAGVSAESHTVTIGDVAGNCTASGGTTRTVTVLGHATTTVSFNVGCVLAERIAFSSSGTIVVMRVDGVSSVAVTHGFSPAWSADGTRLAYECGADICAINPDGSGFAPLTTNAASNRHPTWSPDGTKIAFSAAPSGGPDLWVMGADGSGALRLTQNVGFVGSPAWSPDGTKIAFDCQVDAGNDDICVVNADGTGFVRLTNDAARDYGAAWKPDGSTLAFATTRFGANEIVLMSATTGSVTRIGAGLPGSEPTWSRDGSQLGFVRLDQAGRATILVGHTDGSNVVYVVTGDQPAWRPHP